jgi:hypothetical protein
MGNLPRYALSIGAAAAMLSGCGGSTIPISAANHATGGVGALKNYKTFAYSGKKQTFVVPAGVRRLSVIARGGEGGGGFCSCPSNMYPGLPGRVYAVIRVHPGDKLYVFVGGADYHGGFNGGGLGGADGYGSGKGSGGGGASDIRMGGDTLKYRIIVAAGGGGAGSTGVTAPYGFAPGGNGGGLTGDSGGSAGYSISGSGGGGGTQNAGGSGGAGGRGIKRSGNGQPGDDGTLGRGGNGGNGGTYGSHYAGTEGGGGGAGGGYYGGGGGGGGGTAIKDYWLSQGGGGGGGSSYVQPSAITSRMWTGWREGGDGRVIFGWL